MFRNKSTTAFNKLKEQKMMELKSAGLYLIVAPNGVKVTDYRIHFVHCSFLFHFLHERAQIYGNMLIMSRAKLALPQRLA